MSSTCRTYFVSFDTKLVANSCEGRLNKLSSSTAGRAMSLDVVVQGKLCEVSISDCPSDVHCSKTTTMLFKILGIERTWESLRGTLDESITRPRQIFVTQSRVLAEKVEEYYRKLTESHIAATRSAQESTEIGAQKRKPEDRALVDHDEEEYWHGSLPKRFSDLQDEHFPLFLTFDHVSLFSSINSQSHSVPTQLCRLLEEDFRAFNKNEFSLAFNDDEDLTSDTTTVASDYMLQRRDSFVSYGTFQQAYWPHLPQSLTKNFGELRLFTESRLSG